MHCENRNNLKKIRDSSNNEEIGSRSSRWLYIYVEI